MKLQALRRAIELQDRGKLDKAERLYAGILASQPQCFEALHRLGVLHFRAARYAEALRRLDGAVRVKPTDVVAVTNLARLQARLNLREDALAHFDRAVALNPDFVDAHLSRGEILRELGRLEGARASLAMASALRPKHAGTPASPPARRRRKESSTRRRRISSFWGRSISLCPMPGSFTCEEIRSTRVLALLAPIFRSLAVGLRSCGNRPLCHAYETLMAHWRAALPEGIMIEVRYEDLVDDLEGEARRMLAHIGLDWDPRCLDFHATERTVRTASAAQVRRPVYRSSIARWRAFEGRVEPLLAELRPSIAAPK